MEPPFDLYLTLTESSHDSVFICYEIMCMSIMVIIFKHLIFVRFHGFSQLVVLINIISLFRAVVTIS